MMEDNTQTALKMAAYALIMVATATFLLFSLQIQDRSVNTVVSWHDSSDHRVAKTTEIISNETYTGSQVQQSLNNIIQLKVIIQVDGRIYPYGNKVESSDVDSIDTNRMYTVNYEWDNNGIITKMIFN